MILYDNKSEDAYSSQRVMIINEKLISMMKYSYKILKSWGIKHVQVTCQIYVDVITKKNSDIVANQQQNYANQTSIMFDHNAGTKS